MKVWQVLLIILVILIAVLVVLIFLANVHRKAGGKSGTD